MSKLKDTLLMMAVEKETFKIGDKTFQIIEVVKPNNHNPTTRIWWVSGLEFLVDVNDIGMKE